MKRTTLTLFLAAGLVHGASEEFASPADMADFTGSFGLQIVEVG